MRGKRRDSSSSSDDLQAKKLAKKRLCQKRDVLKLAAKSHSIKKKQRLDDEWTKSARRVDDRLDDDWDKSSRQSSSRMREKEIEKKRERMRMLEKERIRSPKMRPKSRTPVKRRTPSASPAKPSRYSTPVSRPLERRVDSRERERDRRDKERLEREAAREKERRDALARCQERQRERERLAKEKSRGRAIEEEPHVKVDRLLPRPAERAAMALAAARGLSRESIERERHANAGRNVEKKILMESYGSRSEYSEHASSYSGRRHEKESIRESERPAYDEGHGRREERRSEFQASTSYVEEPRHRSERRADWAHEESYERPPDRHQSIREWEHSSSGRHAEHSSTSRENYAETRDWAPTSESSSKWERRESHGKPSTWQQSETENWDRYHGTEKVDAGASASTSPGAIGKGIVSRRWNTWRGRGRGTHHQTEFRRPHHHEIYEERGDVYRRHINPQGTKSTTEPGMSHAFPIKSIKSLFF